jgi:NodT family efflux transporter outer membrane factor (OMF) lipoprotein
MIAGGRGSLRKRPDSLGQPPRAAAKLGAASFEFGAHSDGFAAVVASAHVGGDRSDWARRGARRRIPAWAPALILPLALVVALAGCAVGPDYVPEAAPVPNTFKELKGWKVATPSDQLDRGDWWAFYRDPKLAFLLKQVEISNQTVASQAAAYLQARALIRESQAALLPTVSASYPATRSFSGPKAGAAGTIATAAAAGNYSTTFSPGFTGTWDLDVWGKVRRQIESNAAATQASAADLDNAKLAAQAALATAYFNLRAADSLYALLVRYTAEYKKNLVIVTNQFKAGFSVTEGDVKTAEAQVLSTEAQALQALVQRAQFEHAIAILIGRPPAEFSIGTNLLGSAIPRIPVSVPSSLLERRPDIAAAERTMQEQNALIGVAVAGYYPDISLTGVLQWTGSQPAPFNVANIVWSLGATGTQVLFNGGLTGAQVDAARAVYYQSVANYRQTVLTAFQQVEDQLVAIRLLKQQVVLQQKAVADQRRAVDVFINQFQAGTVAYTTVVQGEIILLSDEEALLTARQDLFLASVSLIEALGGGWDANLLPTKEELKRDSTLFPQLPPNGAALRLAPPPDNPASH